MHPKSPSTSAADTAEDTAPLDFCLVEVSTAVSDAELKLLNFGPAFEANASEGDNSQGESPVLAVSRQDGTPGLAPADSGFVHARMPERWVLERLHPICRPIVLTEAGAAAAAAASSAGEGAARWRLLSQVGGVCRLRRRFLTQRPLPVEAAAVLSQPGGVVLEEAAAAAAAGELIAESENQASSAGKRKKKKKRRSDDQERQASPEPAPEPMSAVPSEDQQQQQSSHAEDEQKKSKKRKKHKRERHSESSI